MEVIIKRKKKKPVRKKPEVVERWCNYITLHISSLRKQNTVEGENHIKSYHAMNTANKSLLKVEYLRLIGLIRMDIRRWEGDREVRSGDI